MAVSAGSNMGKIFFFAEKRIPWGTSAAAEAALPGPQNFSNDCLSSFYKIV